ncbi:MAG: histone deacetylase [Parachlamydiaceae bacterium]|nr:histone deacetylase [Parachlamydiaceae bacterium]
MTPLTIIHHPECILHLTGQGHPECPERYIAVINELQNQGYLQEASFNLLAKKASNADILRCHSQIYVNRVKAECEYLRMLNIPEATSMLSTGDVQICSNSFEIALLAAGAGLLAVDKVMQEKSKTAFCAMRPPGHHATTSQGMGFCLFNNIAIAARYAQATYNVKKVLIVDWDVHHGNGTQEIFYNDPSVFYFSTHQEGIYPGTGKKEDIGAGNIYNCPISGGKNSRLEVLKAYEDDLANAMLLFKPELVLISAGFDAHHTDPLGGYDAHCGTPQAGFDLITQDFTTLTEIVQKIAKKHCQGKIVSILEGGYNLKALAESVRAHTKILSE